jgi:hypothetical protein
MITFCRTWAGPLDDPLLLHDRVAAVHRELRVNVAITERLCTGNGPAE